MSHAHCPISSGGAPVGHPATIVVQYERHAGKTFQSSGDWILLYGR